MALISIHQLIKIHLPDEVSAWIVVESDVHSTGCSTERYKPIEVAAFPGVVLIPNADIFNFNEIIEKYEVIGVLTS